MGWDRVGRGLGKVRDPLMQVADSKSKYTEKKSNRAEVGWIGLEKGYVKLGIL